MRQHSWFRKKKQILSEELGISILVAVLRSHIPLNHDGQSWKTSCQITTDSPTWKIQKGENSENSTGTIISYDLPWWFIIGSTSFTGSLDPNYSKCLGHTEVRLSRGVGYPGHWRYLPSSHAPVHIQQRGVWFATNGPLGELHHASGITDFPPWKLWPRKSWNTAIHRYSNTCIFFSWTNKQTTKLTSKNNKTTYNKNIKKQHAAAKTPMKIPVPTSLHRAAFGSVHSFSIRPQYQRNPLRHHQPAMNKPYPYSSRSRSRVETIMVNQQSMNNKGKQLMQLKIHTLLIAWYDHIPSNSLPLKILLLAIVRKVSFHTNRVGYVQLP